MVAEICASVMSSFVDQLVALRYLNVPWPGSDKLYVPLSRGHQKVSSGH